MEPGAMTVDAHGRVIVTARANAPVDVASLGVTGVAPRCLFVAKYDTDGTLLWAKQLGTAGSSSQVMGVAAGADDSIVLAGHFEGGPLSLGGADLVNADSSPGTTQTDVFVAKLDAQGNHLWSRRAGGVGYDYAGGVAVDPTGRVVVAAQIDDHLAVLWLSAAGDLLLETVTPGYVDVNGGIAVAGVATDADGDAFVAGTTAAGADFGGGPTPGSPWQVGFVASYAASGGLRWVKTFSTSAGDTVTAEGVATSGILAHGDRVIVTGSFPGTVDFGGGPVTAGAEWGWESGFVVALATSDGAHLWSYGLSDGASSPVLGVTRDPQDRVALTATWQGSASFGGHQVTGQGLHLVTVSPADGSFVAARAIWEIPPPSTLDEVSPIWVDPTGHLAFDLGFAGTIHPSFATIDASPGSIEDLLVVRLPP
jgi:hypothetical protein